MINNAMSLGGQTGAFVAHGEKLLFGLTVIAVAWTAIKNVIEDKGINKVIIDYATIAFMWGIASWTMTGFVPIDGKDGSKEIRVVDALIGGFDQLTDQLTPGGGDGKNQVITALGESVIVASKIFMPSDKAVQQQMPADAHEAVAKATKGEFSTDGK